MSSSLRRAIWQVVWSLLAAVLSVYIAYLVARSYERGAGDYYEPKDFERQQLYEQTGRSVTESERKK